MKIFRLIRSISLVALAITAAASWAAEFPRDCAGPLTDAPSSGKVVLLWWPHSEYPIVSHMAIELDGRVWSAFLLFKEEGSAIEHDRAARVRRGMLRIPIRVNEAECGALRDRLKAREGRWTGGTCSSGLYALLESVGIFRGSSIPATLPTTLVLALLLRKGLGDPRIGRFEWIGRKIDSRVFPFPKMVLPSPGIEMWATAGVAAGIDMVSPDLAHDLLARGQDLYQWFHPFLH